MIRHRLLTIDWWLLTPVIVLVSVSLTVLFSLSSEFFTSQLVALFLSVIIFLFISQMDITRFKPFANIIYFASLIFLTIVLIIGIESHGAVRWVSIFGIQLQFSEICKPFLALSLAAFLSERSNMSAKSFLTSICFLIPVILLLFLQPDLGNTVIYICVALSTLLVFGFPTLWFFLGMIPLIVISPFIWSLLHDYQRQRIMTFIHPSHDPLGKSYNVIQAIIAVGSGMFLGKGLGEGSQSGLRFLPERQTDFIFATLSEKLGFLGSLIILFAFFFLCYRILIIIRRTDDIFSKILATSAFCFIIIHFFTNIGMNLGLVPVVGITLPFVSFGGSSLLSNFILIGFVSNISTSIQNNKVLEIH